ncbi:hypothetical protein MBLNU457_3240t2 [Dothideomycetes sp. NU457]
MLASIVFAVFSAAAVMANPIALVERQSSRIYCANTYYTVASIDDAVNAGCNYLAEGRTVNDYPHQYHDYEGFNFPVNGPYYEFPLEKGYAYDGGQQQSGASGCCGHTKSFDVGSPGADRAIFNSNCEYAGSITHNGASGDDFVGCSDTD